MNIVFACCFLFGKMFANNLIYVSNLKMFSARFFVASAWEFAAISQAFLAYFIYHTEFRIKMRWIYSASKFTHVFTSIFHYYNDDTLRDASAIKNLFENAIDIPCIQLKYVSLNSFNYYQRCECLRQFRFCARTHTRPPRYEKQHESCAFQSIDV